MCDFLYNKVLIAMIIKLRAKTIGHQLVSKWSTELPLAAQSRLLLMVRTTVREVRLWLFVDLCHTCHLIRGHSRILLKVFRDISVCRVKSASVSGVLFALWGGVEAGISNTKVTKSSLLTGADSASWAIELFRLYYTSLRQCLWKNLMRPSRWDCF